MKGKKRCLKINQILNKYKKIYIHLILLKEKIIFKNLNIIYILNFV